MKAYTVSNTKHSLTVVAKSKLKAEELVRRHKLIQMTMDGYLKVEIDKLVTNIKLDYEENDVVGATLNATYSNVPFYVHAEDN